MSLHGSSEPATHPLFRTGVEEPQGADGRPRAAPAGSDAEQAGLAERITRLAAAALAAPMASLAVAVGEGLYLKGCVGFPAGRTPRIGSPFLCPLSKHVFTTGASLAVGDVAAHPLGAGHAGLAALGVRAYLGEPLRAASGSPLGMLSVFAHEPRQWSDAHQRLLADLATFALEESERRTAARAAADAEQNHGTLLREGESRAAAERLSALARLAGTAAHDFNNVLTAIRGYAQIALHSAEALSASAVRAEDAARLAADLRAIVAATERGSALTGRLLAFAGRQAVEPVVLDLNATVAAAQPALRRVTGDQIELRVILDAREANVRADAARLEELLVALALNACDAMPRGGRLSVETSNVASDDELFRRAALPGGPYVALKVRDTGVGMDAATAARAVEPFYTTKEASSEPAGLGLSTVYGIARQCAGDVAIESAPGKGTTVTVFLPTTAATSTAPPLLTTGRPRAALAVAGDEGRETGEATVLLVEDEPGVRQLATTVLTRMGHRVVPAAGGEEALRLLAALAADDVVPDLLITDLVMPGMSGSELAVEVARRHPGVGVLYMSGYNEQVVERRGELGAGTLFLDKPFTLEQFAARVRAVLGAARQGDGRAET